MSALEEPNNSLTRLGWVTEGLYQNRGDVGGPVGEADRRDSGGIPAHGERQSGASTNWVSATAMQEASGTFRQWSSHLKYIFDQPNPIVAKVVILTSYETFATRTFDIEIHKTKTGNKERKRYHGRLVVQPSIALL